MFAPSAELNGFPKALVVWLLDAPKEFPPDPPPNKLPLEVFPDPKAGLLDPANKLPEVLLLFVPPKPPKAFDVPAVAVLLPNILPLLAGLVPKAVLLPPKGLVAVVLAPNPEPEENFMVSGESIEMAN